MLEKKIKVWHLLLIVFFILSTVSNVFNYFQYKSINKLEFVKDSLIQSEKLNDKIIKTLKDSIIKYDIEIKKSKVLIKEIEDEQARWKYSYFKLKKQAENENKNPIHTSTNDKAEYLITKYNRDSK